MYITNQKTYDAAKRFAEVMQSEAPDMYRTFVSYNASEASERLWPTKPQWTPFTSLWNVNSRLYRELAERIAQEYDLDRDDLSAMPSIAAALAKGDKVEIWPKP